MNSQTIHIIKNVISPVIQAGEATLLIGAEFAQRNPSYTSLIPNSIGLRDSLLEACGKRPGPRTTVKDAFAYAERELNNFEDFLKNCFRAKKTFTWQDQIFQYVWKRIYSTGVDDVLQTSYKKMKLAGRNSGEFSFVNYAQATYSTYSIGTIPVISIHGTVEEKNLGFIFSNSEYGPIARKKIMDCYNEVISQVMIGGIIVIGDSMEESDLEIQLSFLRRNSAPNEPSRKNWLIISNPDDIKRENYAAAGFEVIDASPEEFFQTAFASIDPISFKELAQQELPLTKRNGGGIKPMIWFKNTFNSVISEIEKASSETGIVRNFITGSHPQWFFIENNAHAETPKIITLRKRIAALMAENQSGVGILNIVGPSGSGKTTAIRSSLKGLVTTYPYIYEYESGNEVDVDYLISILSNFSKKSIIVFYSAAAFYYTVNALASRLLENKYPYVLFILEERTNTYRKNRHHLADNADSSIDFEFGRISFPDAKAIAEKIKGFGMIFSNFSEHSIDRQARIIMDSEQGYNGDLLPTLFSLTTHENFQDKISAEYRAIADLSAKEILDVIATINSLGFPIPMNYITGFLDITPNTLQHYLNHDLMEIVIPLRPKMEVMCRHRVIADFYFDQFVNGKGRVEIVVKMLEFLSRQFTIADIRLHPLAYEIYKKIISFGFLYEAYFPKDSRIKDTERTYHEAQKFFGLDGVFWLQFGRFYRKTRQLDNAIDCFRTGLTFYDSFQTRHSLGTVLLEKYIENNCTDLILYEEGIEILEKERIRRGPLDPYPTTTLCKLLLTIIKKKPTMTQAADLFLSTVNHGIKNFKDDTIFNKVIKEYYSLGDR